MVRRVRREHLGTLGIHIPIETGTRKLLAVSILHIHDSQWMIQNVGSASFAAWGWCDSPGNFWDGNFNQRTIDVQGRLWCFGCSCCIHCQQSVLVQVQIGARYPRILQHTSTRNMFPILTIIDILVAYSVLLPETCFSFSCLSSPPGFGGSSCHVRAQRSF